jgi:hypothetical protein
MSADFVNSVFAKKIAPKKNVVHPILNFDAA